MTVALLFAIINPEKFYKGKAKRHSRKDNFKALVFCFILFLVFLNIGRTEDEKQNAKVENPQKEIAAVNSQKKEKQNKETKVEPGMVKYDLETGTWIHGSSPSTTIDNGIKSNQLTPDNFFQEVEVVFVPAKITSKGIYKFNDWNDGLNYKTRYPKYYCVELTVGLPTEDLDLALKLSYEFYKTLYHAKKTFRIGHVFLKFEIENKFEKGSMQVSLGEKALKSYFARGDGSVENFISWVENNRTQEPSKYAEDEIWINGGFRGNPRFW